MYYQCFYMTIINLVNYTSLFSIICWEVKKILFTYNLIKTYNFPQFKVVSFNSKKSIGYLENCSMRTNGKYLWIFFLIFFSTHFSVKYLWGSILWIYIYERGRNIFHPLHKKNLGTPLTLLNLTFITNNNYMKNDL